MTALTLTQKQAEKAMAWFLVHMGMEDWMVGLQVGGLRPDWVEDEPENLYGQTCRRRTLKRSEIWVNPATHKAGEDPLGTLFHEGLHLVASDIGYDGDTTPAAEFTWNKLGDLLAKAYRKGVR